MAERGHVTTIARRAHKATGDAAFAKSIALEAAATDSDWEEIQTLLAETLEFYNLNTLGNPAIALGLAAVMLGAKHVNASLAIGAREREAKEAAAEADKAKVAAAGGTPANN